jgi:DNA processing protein
LTLDYKRAFDTRDLALLEQLGARILTPDDADWPAGLSAAPNPPAFLTVRGPLPPGGVAVVGAREAGESACAFARELAARLGRAVISGLAPGIDAAAHRGALDAGLPTVAYLGSGLSARYAPEHGELAEAIVAGGGALAAEQSPLEEATSWSLRQRDRLQAAHAGAVVLIVSEIEGGAMHTLRFARQLGRARFALADAASGNRRALLDGAAALPWNVEVAVSRIAAALP